MEIKKNNKFQRILNIFFFRSGTSIILLLYIFVSINFNPLKSLVKKTSLFSFKCS